MGVARIFQRGGHTDSYIGYSPNCHLNIVGCLLTKRLTKGGSRAPQDPPPPATPMHSIYHSTEDADLPTSTVQTLTACDREFFPNIHILICILLTLPITSVECRDSFSTLRRLKTYLRSTMSSERESGLALARHKYRGGNKHVRSKATKSSSVCVA